MNQTDMGADELFSKDNAFFLVTMLTPIALGLALIAYLYRAEQRAGENLAKLMASVPEPLDAGEQWLNGSPETPSKERNPVPKAASYWGDKGMSAELAFGPRNKGCLLEGRLRVLGTETTVQGFYKAESGRFVLLGAAADEASGKGEGVRGDDEDCYRVDRAFGQLAFRSRAISLNLTYANKSVVRVQLERRAKLP